MINSSNERVIYLSINEFIRPIGGEFIDKTPDYFGGHYKVELLPTTMLEVVNTSTTDLVGIHRQGSGKTVATGDRDKLEIWADNQPW